MVPKDVVNKIWKELYDELLDRYIKEKFSLEIEVQGWKNATDVNAKEIINLKQQYKQCQKNLLAANDEVRSLTAKIAESEEKTMAVFDTIYDEGAEMVKEYQEAEAKIACLAKEVAQKDKIINKLRNENSCLNAKITNLEEKWDEAIVDAHHWKGMYERLAKQQSLEDAASEVEADIGLTD